MHVATSRDPAEHVRPDRPLRERYRITRRRTLALVEPLSDADSSIQSMTDASPAKWHLAHTTWFFETFLLRDHLTGYRLHDERWPFLFNSYYEAEGPRHARAARGLLSRPSLNDVIAWRTCVDEAMESLLEREKLADLVSLGIAHEEQHQELLLTDIKHAFWCNPLGPAYRDALPSRMTSTGRAGWIEHPGGVVAIGHRGSGFAFDNEGPVHRVLLEPYALADRLVTNGQWQEFVDDGGYKTASLWLSDGWEWVCREGIDAPLYWRDDDGPEQFSHYGWVPRSEDEPVLHLSYFEADAFAQWAGCRLPTEFEWEALAQQENSESGQQLDGNGSLLPGMSEGLFGAGWIWTRSAYLPYPRFRPAGGAVGEYNGKFMSGQYVLRGASCATPRGSSRCSYRNFFYPHQRWQFTSLRLARDG